MCPATDINLPTYPSHFQKLDGSRGTFESSCVEVLSMIDDLLNCNLLIARYLQLSVQDFKEESCRGRFKTRHHSFRAETMSTRTDNLNPSRIDVFPISPENADARCFHLHKRLGDLFDNAISPIYERYLLMSVKVKHRSSAFRQDFSHHPPCWPLDESSLDGHSSWTRRRTKSRT